MGEVAKNSGEALSRLKSKGTWVDYVRSLVAR